MAHPYASLYAPVLQPALGEISAYRAPVARPAGPAFLGRRHTHAVLGTLYLLVRLVGQPRGSLY